MNIIEHQRFGAVDGYRFGFGPLGPPLMSVYLYFVDGLLIDTALSNMRRQVVSVVRELRPQRVVLTHHHEDHSGNAAILKAACGAEVIGHPLTVTKMKKTGRIFPYQHLVWAGHAACRFLRFAVRSSRSESPSRRSTPPATARTTPFTWKRSKAGSSQAISISGIKSSSSVPMNSWGTRSTR